MENNFKQYTNISKQYKNIIFYGSSGSGKTYNAVKTIENFNDKKTSFSVLEKENRVKLISFHKHFSYYDFIESKDNNLFKNGIFKELCVDASLDIIKNSIKGKIKNNISVNSKIWKVYLGYRKTEERIYLQAKKDKEIVLGWLENESLEGKSYNEIYSMMEARRGNDEPRLSADVASIHAVVNEMKIGDFVVVYQNNTTISDIGVINSDYFHDYGTPYPHKRKINWIKEFKNNLDISEYDNKNFNDLRTFYPLQTVDFSDLREIMNLENINESAKPYFLIIDNIDKADIFSIFGEAFSLLNKNENQKIILHQSGKKFSIPQNIFIIGTAQAIIKDIQVQKRFAFIKSNFISSKKININNKSLDLSVILLKINSKLADNSKQPLSYGFLEDISNLEEFYNFWYYQLIPYLISQDLSLNDISELIGKEFIQDDIIYHSKHEFLDLIRKIEN